MRNYLQTMPCKVFRILVVFIAVSIPVEAAAHCFVTVELYNYQRRVPGEVNVECTAIHYSKNPLASKYEKGFGNWGVMSDYGAVRNGFQFAGWYPADGWRQWQSCTKKLPKPDCKAYNSPDCTGQEAVPDNENRYGGHGFAHYTGTCESIGVHTTGNIDMHIVELDWDLGEGHDPVASLIYGSVDVPLTCSGAWNCRGESGWIYASSGAGTVNARAQVRVRTRFREIGR